MYLISAKGESSVQRNNIEPISCVKEEIDVEKTNPELTSEQLMELAAEQVTINNNEKYEVQFNQDNIATSNRNKGIDKGIFTATAYDLSVQSCGKTEEHPAYGITANGTDLKGQTLESARAIAVDPNVIPLGTKVYIEFIDEEYQYLNGEYTAVDTGSAIKGEKIDIFFGSGDVAEEVRQFGVRKVKVTIILND